MPASRGPAGGAGRVGVPEAGPADDARTDVGRAGAALFGAAAAAPPAADDRGARNRAYYESFRNFQPPNELGQRFDAERAATHTTADGGIRGVGASPGIVEGTARVIDGLPDIGRLQPGDILVTTFTDTGWTGKFALISGIVTEYGGILTHAAIVSREYGIPCVVACHDVMTSIPDGARVRVDGTTGEVVLL